MTKDQAFALVQSINAMQPYVPPVVFSSVINSDAARLLAMIAGGQAVCEIKPLAEPPKEAQPGEVAPQEAPSMGAPPKKAPSRPQAR